IIQSGFLLHLALEFLFGLFPWRVERGARLFLLWLNKYSYTVLSSWPDRALISLKNKSRFLVLPKTRKMAFSFVCLPVLLNPRFFKSTGFPLSETSSSKHNFHMSKTSHLDASMLPMGRESKRRAAFLFAGHVNNFICENFPESPDFESVGFFLRIRNSAPSKPSFSKAVMSKMYFCLLATGILSSAIYGEKIKGTHRLEGSGAPNKHLNALRTEPNIY
uniref:Maturase K n=1 Tax=Leptobrachium leishanense TaxID=445787 RepID=A0A8C5QMW1_9ANUR